ncbi:MAG: hypothetical protein GWO21_15095, partial [Gammaproteobacteria bacterium]|nr:hypothetical protein [Gammaproteobacteria bacterium]
IKRYGSIVRYPELFGPALIAQGGMAMAIALDYRFLAPGETSTFFVSVTLTALAINSFISPFTTKRMLIMEGETT